VQDKKKQNTITIQRIEWIEWAAGYRSRVE
jgi:hypothetical protein